MTIRISHPWGVGFPTGLAGPWLVYYSASQARGVGGWFGVGLCPLRVTSRTSAGGLQRPSLIHSSNLRLRLDRDPHGANQSNQSV